VVRAEGVDLVLVQLPEQVLGVKRVKGVVRSAPSTRKVISGDLAITVG